MEGRFPDGLLKELRSALQNQCVFGLCRFLKFSSRRAPKSFAPWVLDYFEVFG
jgi:hypothetical protein